MTSTVHHHDLPRSPFGNVLHFVPQGHEKALKQAFYNAAAIVFVIFAGAAAAAVFLVLEPFLRPLLWAVLCGSFLHPFKYSFTCISRKWLENIKESGSPLILGFIVLPIGVIDRAAETIGGHVFKYSKMILGVSLGLTVTYLVCTFTPFWLFSAINVVKDFILLTVGLVINAFSSMWVWTMIVAYYLVVLFHWTPDSRQPLSYMSIPIWIMITCQMANVLGVLQVPILLSLLLLLIIGIVMEIKESSEEQEGNEEETLLQSESQSALSTAWSILTGSPRSRKSSLVDATGVRKDLVSTPAASTPDPHNPTKPKQLKTQRSSSWDASAQAASNTYLYGVMWACLLLGLCLHIWMLPLIMLPVIYLVIKRAGSHTGLWSFIKQKLVDTKSLFMDKIGDRGQVLLPQPVRVLGRTCAKGDRKAASALEKFLDTAVTVALIMIVLLLAVVATVFIMVQIHAESMHLIQVTGNLINTTIIHNPDLQDLLPEGMGDVFDSMFDNAYVYGREWSVNMVKNLIGEKDKAKAAHLEKQVLELWDQVYHAWSNSSSSSSTQEAMGSRVSNSWDSLMSSLSPSSGLYNFNAVIDFVKENIDMFITVLNSVWIVLKGNINIAISAVTATLSILFGGGSALLNFFLNVVVFMTALFYLLSSSGEQYKGIELLSKFAPSGNGDRFGLACEAAIHGVFTASFKMAAFYGMWTWLIHTLFNIKIVYIPSAVASILGGVPFLGTYWACLPAVMELWFVHGQNFKAVLMFIMQVLPMSFVDTAIYSEIKGGGHPYLTALAIAGGIFLLGVEGAIIGPLLLCSLFVAMNMYGTVMLESPVNEAIRRRDAKLLNSFYVEACSGNLLAFGFYSTPQKITVELIEITARHEKAGKCADLESLYDLY